MKAVVLYSGGIDSRVALQLAIKKHTAEEVLALTFDYGQRNIIELDYASRICKQLGVKQEIIKLDSLGAVSGGSLMLSDSNVPLPEGNAEDPSMAAMVMPNRNGIFISFAYAVAIQSDAQDVYYATHTGAEDIYRDCSKDFVDAFAAVGRALRDPPVNLVTPFVTRTKHEIVVLAALLGVDINDTYTCYAGGEKQCGRCGTCQARLEALGLGCILNEEEYLQQHLTCPMCTSTHTVKYDDAALWIGTYAADCLDCGWSGMVKDLQESNI